MSLIDLADWTNDLNIKFVLFFHPKLLMKLFFIINISECSRVQTAMQNLSNVELNTEMKITYKYNQFNKK